MIQIGATKGREPVCCRASAAQPPVWMNSRAFSAPANRFEYLNADAAIDRSARHQLRRRRDSTAARRASTCGPARARQRPAGAVFEPRPAIYAEGFHAAPAAPSLPRSLSRQDFEMSWRSSHRGYPRWRSYERFAPAGARQPRPACTSQHQRRGAALSPGTSAP